MAHRESGPEYGWIDFIMLPEKEMFTNEKSKDCKDEHSKGWKGGHLLLIGRCHLMKENQDRVPV
jgi:hypothetical protein